MFQWYLPVVAMHDYVPALYMKHMLCNFRLYLASAGYDAQSRHRSLGKALEIDHNCLVSPLIERQSSMGTICPCMSMLYQLLWYAAPLIVLKYFRCIYTCRVNCTLVVELGTVLVKVYTRIQWSLYSLVAHTFGNLFTHTQTVELNSAFSNGKLGMRLWYRHCCTISPC